VDLGKPSIFCCAIQRAGTPLPAAITQRSVSTRCLRTVRGVHQVRLVTIIDAQGFQRHRSRGSPPPDLNVSDRSYFIAQRDRTGEGSLYE